MSEIAVVRPDRQAVRRAADGELVRRALEGDQRAWEMIVQRHQSLLWWIARQFRLSTDDAADAVQLTWLRCLEHLHQLTDEGALGSWLVTICRRECFRLLTRRSGEVLLAEPEDHERASSGALGGGAPDPCEVVARRDERTRLREAIDALPPRPRSVLTAMLTQETEGYAEIARQLGVPIGSLGPTRNRALARLRTDPRLALVDS
ncbi:MAG TPA: sigma-70 family RNA polymerase sigma factor [Kineosporiaceae bacterium]